MNKARYNFIVLQRFQYIWKEWMYVGRTKKGGK